MICDSHSIISQAPNANGFTLAQGVVIMAFLNTHLAVPMSKRVKIGLMFNVSKADQREHKWSDN